VIATRVISVLRMKPFTLEDWRQLPAAGKSIGTTGKPTRHLWEWTLTYRIPNSPNESVCSQDLQRESAQVSMVNENKLKITCTVSTALKAVGQTIALACDSNPTKVTGSERFLPCLQIMLDGYHKVDPPTKKVLPVQGDVPELLIETAYKFGSSERDKATANLTMIAFYYLLCIGKYTVKGTLNNSKQTVQFKYEDVTFFRKNNLGQLRCLTRDAPGELISTADGATLKLEERMERGVRLPQNQW
jgi:hypothetical protein